MRKIFVSILCVFIIVNTFLINMNSTVAEEESIPFEINAKSAILIELKSGKSIVEKNPDEEFPIASITKIMTMLLVLEAVENGKIAFADSVVISEHAYSMGGSQVYLKPGEVFEVEELFKAIAIHSANDACVALAELVAGTESSFVDKMNEKAASLGMKNTHFIDCTGLTDEGHYSTAKDIAIVSREAILKHPAILKYTSTWYDTFRDGTFDLYNRNILVKNYSGCNGLKTGSTTKAGFCLSASAVRNDMNLISVVLGTTSDDLRFSESVKLLDYGFKNYEIVNVSKKGDIIENVAVRKGLEELVPVVIKEDVFLLVNKANKDKIEKKITAAQEFEAPVKKDISAGSVTYMAGNTELGQVELVTEREVERASFFQLFLRLLKKWFKLGK